MIMAYEVETRAPIPAARLWATALTSYVQAEGAEFLPDARGGKRWLFGVTFTPFGCDDITGDALDICDDDRETTYSTLAAPVVFKPFLAEVAVERPVLCSTAEELTTYVTERTLVQRSSILGAQVERSEYQTVNPSLASSAADVSGDDSSIAGALFYVEQGLADTLKGGAGMIHMPPGVFATLAAQGGVRYDLNGRPFTHTGHLIVADAGYIGASPHAEDAVSGEIWIYGSGPVVAKYDEDLIIPGGLDVFSRPRNEWKIDAEQYGIAFFDPCTVVAAVIGFADDNLVDGPVGS